MADTVLDLALYYLTRETPDGSTLLLYPVAAIDGARAERYERTDPGDDAHVRRGWTFEIDDPAGMAWTFAGPWLVADREVHVIRRTRPGERKRDGWQLREDPHNPNDGPVSPDLQAAFEDMPERPDADLLAHYREHEAAHVCWRCLTFVASYTARWTQGDPIVETQRLDGWRELPGGEDPAPEREWRVTEPGYLTLYGQHTAHLWPGVLTGLRQAVLAALDEHPLVASFTSYDNVDRGKVSASIRVPFDPPRTIDKRVPVTPRARKRTTLITEDVFGINTSVRDVRVPDEVRGPSKAAALDAWQRCVDEQVRRFVPVLATARVCGHCDGLGITDAGS